MYLSKLLFISTNKKTLAPENFRDCKGFIIKIVNSKFTICKSINICSTQAYMVLQQLHQCIRLDLDEAQ